MSIAFKLKIFYLLKVVDVGGWKVREGPVEITVPRRWMSSRAACLHALSVLLGRSTLNLGPYLAHADMQADHTVAPKCCY